MPEQNIQEKSDFKIKGSVERPPIDLSEFIGKRVKISSIMKKVGNFNNRKSPYLLLETEVVGKKTFGGSELEFKATKILPLSFDEENNVVWIKGAKTDLFLKKLKVDNPEELLWKEVVIQLTEPNKEGKQFLTF